MNQAAIDPQTTDFTSDALHVTVVRQPHCKVEFKVTTKPSLNETARKQGLKEVNKSVSLPGFRKGKAPDAMIAKKFPREVEQEARQALADLAFAEARKLTAVPLLNNRSQITYDMVKHDAQGGSELRYTFETEPVVPAVDPKAFQPTTINKAVVDEAKIDEAIHQVRFYHAEWTAVEDRPVAEGDYVLLDIDSLEVDPPERVFHGTRFEVSPARMADWMRALVVGKQKGDVIDGISHADANATEAEKQEFQPRKVRLTITAVEEAKLPPVDDEFAKKAGSESIAAMREWIRGLLTDNVEKDAREQMREQVNLFLVTHYPFDLPDSLIKAEEEHRMKQKMDSAKQTKQWEAMTELERADEKGKIRADAERAVRLFYLTRKIAQDAQLLISHQEVQDEAIQMMDYQGRSISIDQIPKDVYALAISTILLRKAQDHLMQAYTARD